MNKNDGGAYTTENGAKLHRYEFSIFERSFIVELQILTCLAIPDTYYNCQGRWTKGRWKI